MKKSLKLFLLLVILIVIALPICDYNTSYANMIAPPERMIKYSGDFQDKDQTKDQQEDVEKQKIQLINEEQKNKENKPEEKQQSSESESKKQKNEKLLSE